MHSGALIKNTCTWLQYCSSMPLLLLLVRRLSLSLMLVYFCISRLLLTSISWLSQQEARGERRSYHGWRLGWWELRCYSQPITALLQPNRWGCEEEEEEDEDAIYNFPVDFFCSRISLELAISNWFEIFEWCPGDPVARKMARELLGPWGEKMTGVERVTFSEWFGFPSELDRGDGRIFWYVVRI